MSGPAPGAYRRATEVPKSAKPPGEVVRLTGGQSFEVTIISPKLWGFYIHFDPSTKRSDGCKLDPSICEGCQKHLPQKTLFYLYAIHPAKGCVYVELTDGAARQLEQVFPPPRSMRCERVNIYRTRSDKGRLNITVREARSVEEALPPDRDPLPLLQFLWNARRAPVKKEA